MYRLMTDCCDELLAELCRISDVRRYVALRDQMRTVDVSTDLEFQNAYRDYWRMSLSRHGTYFYSQYFRRMQALRQSDSKPTAEDLRTLSLLSDRPDRPSLQFSFATKLLTTLDPREPVYDTHVTSFYFFIPPASDRPLEARLAGLLDFYDFLRGEYARVLSHGLLEVPIRRFRQEVADDPSLADERVVDLLIWGFTSLMRRGVQQRGHVLYR